MGIDRRTSLRSLRLLGAYKRLNHSSSPLLCAVRLRIPSGRQPHLATTKVHQVCAVFAFFSGTREGFLPTSNLKTNDGQL
jgi:hypothetical protein